MDKNMLHRQLTDLGLERVDYTEKAVYQYNIYSEATAASYPLTLTTFTSEHGNTIVHFHEAGFPDNRFVPLEVRRAALDKLIELERLCNGPSGKTLEEANNSSMAQDLDEIKKLGNEMKHMKTNSELIEKNLIPDPIQ
ncbi:hypothetical protein HZF08_31480 [Paenibacillus sp. CGMCC 1.16610]|uniref:Uncharacterized protein n=1 Tax=Paenibacillus anseongense TaxID=2682845 RepID=A0ABW9UG09_9BACL|nr:MULTISPECIES: hypothetical protein [Paenibacillus]MBA2942796.1 hypothetical protein [Paenibacillus sp. CGMCC 1.16610]MVQ38281.1 hypothetical protein [Paenibacillus anseongense]